MREHSCEAARTYQSIRQRTHFTTICIRVTVNLIRERLQQFQQLSVNIFALHAEMEPYSRILTQFNGLFTETGAIMVVGEEANKISNSWIITWGFCGSFLGIVPVRLWVRVSPAPLLGVPVVVIAAQVHVSVLAPVRRSVKILRCVAHLLPAVIMRGERSVADGVEVIPLREVPLLRLQHIPEIPPRLLTVRRAEKVSAHRRSGVVRLPCIDPLQRRARIRKANI